MFREHISETVTKMANNRIQEPGMDMKIK